MILTDRLDDQALQNAWLAEAAASLARMFSSLFVALLLFIGGMLLGYSIATPAIPGEAEDISAAVESDSAIIDPNSPIPF